LVAFLPYLFVFRRDLKHNGNRPPELFRAMALNAMLLPINFAGAINSLQQLWTGRKIPFQRTPKVPGRTAAPPVHIAAQFGLLLFAITEAKQRCAAGQWVACLFFAWYAAALGYAIRTFGDAASGSSGDVRRSTRDFRDPDGCRGTHDHDTKAAGRDRGLEGPRGRLRQRIRPLRIPA